MGKKAKLGKQRKDRFYKLAKETGFRSRAAFKLIQLNRKFGFLQKSRVCIDLCAAPGGWMQVAHENMPTSSIVIGVDLYPIKPVPGCLSIIGDITTEKCRVDLSRELKTWKADVVLNDGAPNVGQNWLHDAFQQSTLTLSALKLALHFLKPNGWFVTKVFRSKDYTALLHVFKQLFKKVHATKPQASRDESAEIFVVCQGYLAPVKPDPKLLCPKHVFADLDLEPTNKYNVFNPEKQKKAKPEGYPENDYTLFHSVPVKDFIAAPSAIAVLEHASEIVVDDEKVLNHPKTTKEIVECCKDIKVLGRKDLRSIMNWWKVLKEEFDSEKESKKEDKLETENKEEEKVMTLEEEEDLEDEKISEEIKQLREEKARELKRKRKKANKEKSKLNQKMNLNMYIKGDQGPIEECDDMFSLKRIKHSLLHQINDQDPNVVAESDEEEETQTSNKVRYQKDTGHLDSQGLFYKDDESELEFSEDDSDKDPNFDMELSEPEDDEELAKPKKKVRFDIDEEHDDKSVDNEDNDNNEENDEGGDDDDEEEDDTLVTDLDYMDPKSKKVRKAQLWFERDIFKNLETDRDADMDIAKAISVLKKKGVKVIGEEDEEDNKIKIVKNVDHVKNDNSDDSSDDDSDDERDSDDDSDYNMDHIMKTEIKSKDKSKNKTVGKDDLEIVPQEKPAKIKKKKLTLEDLALGSVMAHSKKARRDVIDGAWNRYAFNDPEEHLPTWFVEDEKQNMKKEVPVPKEYVDDYKKRVEDINARPIKKVLEAKARKKKRALRKLATAKKKIEAVMENPDLSERDKSKQVKSLYRNANKEPKQKLTYVVSKKHLAQKRVPRPPGVKGRFKVVDPRMKKDLRAQKAKEKTKGRGKKGRGGKPPRGKARGKRAR